MPRSFQRFQKSILSLLAIAVLCIVPQVDGATTLYFNNFGTTTITGATYTGVPTLDAAITTAVWTTSASGFTSFGGSSGQALSLGNSSGTPTITLTLTLDALYTLDLASWSFWRQRSSSGAQNWSLSVNGTAVNAGTVPTTGASTGTLTPSTTAFGGSAGLSQYTFQFSLSGASGTGTFRLDDFLLTGTFAAPVVAGSEIYWRGSDPVRGGSGTWSNADASWFSTNVDGGTNVVWDPTKKAIFGGTGDTVTVLGTVAAAAGMEFQSTGYTVTGGDAINLTGASPAVNTVSTASDVTATIATNITGSNGMTKAGPGTLILTGDKGYTGGTTVSGGTLQLGDGTINGSVAGNVVNNATVAFNNGSAQTFGGDISGSGSLIKNGAGALTLTGTNSYNGATTVSAGSLIGTTASLQGAITNNAAVTFDQTTDGTYAGNMSGSGSLTKSGAGTVTLSGTNSYSGGTTVSAGRLIGTTASLQGAIVSNAAVTFDQTTNGTYAGNMSGSGSLTKAGAGTVTLSGTNSYSGGTTVSAGRLIGTTSSLQGAITNNAAVTFDQASNGTYAGVMSGTGSLTKTGPGSVTLTGGNGYSGGTSINGGTLVAGDNSALGSAAATLTGGTLFATNSITIANDLVINVPDVPSLLITQYYEGTSNNKWIELTNIGSGSIDLAAGAFHLGTFANAAAEGYKTNGTPSSSMSLTGTIGVGQSILIAHGSAVTPSYASATLANTSVINFNGNDSVALYSGNTWSTTTIVDAIGFTNSGNEGVDKSFVRISTSPGFNTTAGSNATSFPTVWSDVTLANVDSAVAGTDNRLGFSSLTSSGGGTAIVGSDITSGTATFSGNITLDSNVHLTAAAGGTSRFTGIIANGSNGARGIEKVGAGFVEVTGANTYSGPTTVTAGTLAVNNTTGSGTGTGNVLVKDTAVLAGAGTLSPADGGSIVFESGSTVSVGNTGDTTGQQLNLQPATGTITTTFSSGSVLEFDLFSGVGDQTANPASADRLVINGNAVFQPNVTLKVNTTLNALDFLEGDRWRLLDWSSLSVTGNANDLELELPALSATLTWDTSQLFADGTVGVIIIPEPTRVSLILLAGLALALRRRRAAR